MDSLPLKIFNSGFAVYWLKFSGLELTGGEPQDTVTSFFMVTTTRYPDLYCIKSVTVRQIETLPTRSIL